jgi:hypothetical protein
MDSNLFGRVDMAGPPRCVPLLVRLRVLFGGALDTFGWFFLGFGLIRTVYKLTFEFAAADGRKCRAVAKTHLVEKLEGEPRERLLYDPYSPSRAVMPGAMPGSPRIDENGQIRVDSVLKTLAGLVIPAATIIGHGAYLLSRLK